MCTCLGVNSGKAGPSYWGGMPPPVEKDYHPTLLPRGSPPPSSSYSFSLTSTSAAAAAPSPSASPISPLLTFPLPPALVAFPLSGDRPLCWRPPGAGLSMLTSTIKSPFGVPCPYDRGGAPLSLLTPVSCLAPLPPYIVPPQPLLP